jgi:hypothetical protein
VELTPKLDVRAGVFASRRAPGEILTCAVLSRGNFVRRQAPDAPTNTNLGVLPTIWQPNGVPARQEVLPAAI